MQDWYIGLIFLAVWIVLQFVILPKMGVPT
jgi:hypothetical protein